MIKRAGDWTSDLIDILYEQKKAMMRMDELDIKDYQEREVFNLLHDIYSEIKIKTMMDINKRFFLHANITLPIMSPSESFMTKKNVILIGAGSGIAPYLPLFEEIIRLDKGKSHKYNFDNVILVFIAREGEQVSWISNYMFHLLSCEFISSFHHIGIYVTLQKNDETLSSILFWRSLLLIYNKNLECLKDQEFATDRASSLNNREDHESFKVNQNNHDKIRRRSSSNFNSKNKMTFPVAIQFGRPNFRKIFNYAATLNEKEFTVYA